ncbi:MAG: hypothetical protein AAFQ91_18425 [Cyanobacteria bacterium J06621_15]
MLQVVSQISIFRPLNPYPFPLPPYEEIIEINNRLDALYNFSDIIGQQIFQTNSRLDQLNQS